MFVSLFCKTLTLCPQFNVMIVKLPASPASGHNLVLAKREGSSIAEASNRSPLISCTVRLSTIFDDSETMFASQLDDRVHVARPTRQVDRNDRLCTRRQYFPDTVCSKCLTDRIYVREHRLCTPHDGTTGRCAERAA